MRGFSLDNQWRNVGAEYIIVSGFSKNWSKAIIYVNRREEKKKRF